MCPDRYVVGVPLEQGEDSPAMTACYELAVLTVDAMGNVSLKVCALDKIDKVGGTLSITNVNLGSQDSCASRPDFYSRRKTSRKLVQIMLVDQE